MDNLTLFFLIFGLNSQSPMMDSMMIFGARFAIYLTLILMFVLVFKGGVKERKSLVLALLSIPIIILLIKVIHLFFYQSRPFVVNDILPLIPHAADASFPSRHTSIMSGIAFAYTYFKSRWAPLFLLLMLWVGMARIFVGVHFPLDILGGGIVGIVAVAIALQLKKLLKLRFFSQPLKS